MKNENDILNEDEELKKMAPVLSGVNRENPFTAPEHYFETLPQVIIGKWQRSVTGKERTWRIIAAYKPVMVVATVVVIITIALFFFFANTWRPVQKNVADYSTFTQDEGIINELSDVIDESTIIEAVVTEPFDNFSDTATMAQDDFLIENPDYTNDDLINYLLDANTDTDNVPQ